MRYPQLLATLLPFVAAAVCEAQTTGSSLDLSKIDKPILTEFRRAWNISSNGLSNIEGVVLLFSNPDGSYRAKTLGQTNENRQFTFKWDPNTIAVLHTHPNDANPHPADQDIFIAEHFQVPMFTLTFRGMYMYDPGTKRISKIKEGLSWLETSSWAQDEYIAHSKIDEKKRNQGESQ